MKTHTPGPWEVDKEQRDLRIVAADKATPIAFCSRLYREDATSAALDARLIAAAPELLEFARLVAAGNTEYEDLETAARAAIEKATA